MKDLNMKERHRLFKTARSIEISDYTLKLGCDLVKEKMYQRRTNDAYIETTRNGETVFVGWITKYKTYCVVTFMGHIYCTTATFEDGVKALLQLGYALHNDNYTFIYGK